MGRTKSLPAETTDESIQSLRRFAGNPPFPHRPEHSRAMREAGSLLTLPPSNSRAKNSLRSQPVCSLASRHGGDCLERSEAGGEVHRRGPCGLRRVATHESCRGHDGVWSEFTCRTQFDGPVRREVGSLQGDDDCRSGGDADVRRDIQIGHWVKRG